MVELLLGVHDLELLGDIHVLGALEHLRVDDVGDDRLVFAREVLVQQFRETLAGYRAVIARGFELAM